MKKSIICLASFLSLFLTAILAQPGDSSKIKKNNPPDFVQAYNIKVHMGNMSFDTYVSNAGVIARQSIAGSSPAPKRGIFIRYSDDSVFKIDYNNSVYYGSTLQEADSLMSVERTIAEQTRVSFTAADKKISYKPRQVRNINSIKKFNNLPVSVKSYVSPTNKTWNLYYVRASDLMPSLVARKRIQKQPVDQGNLTALLMPDAENILVHAEVQVDGKNEVIIDLDDSRQVNVPASTFSIPPQLAVAKRRSPARFKENHLQPGPGFKLNQPVSLNNKFIDVTMDHGIGPVVANPSLYVIYWGKQFKLPTSDGALQSLASSMLTIVSKKYTAPLSYYGVNEGKIVQNIYVNDDPPFSAGGGGSGAVVGNFVIDQIFEHQLPKIWWSFGDDDPVYMVLVTENQVDQTGWSGYHFVIPTFYDSFVPFPLNYLMHEELPYAFAKIPNNAMNLGLEDLIQRDNLCKTNPVACQSITSFDVGTKNISHEYVEVCTDPTPFFTWVDAGRGTEGEIGDICETSPAPFSSSTRIGTTTVSTYWSVPANACVPGTQGTIVIKEPKDNETVNWMTGGARPTLFALASDLMDGDLEDIRWKDENGNNLGTGVNIGSQPMSLGPHTITATAFNSLGNSVASAVTHINVTAQEPVPVITSPNSSQTYASDDIINFRGNAMDPQDGDLSDSQLAWSVNGVSIGSGKLLSAKINKTGIVGVTLTATNSAGIQAAVAVLVKLTAANNNSSIKIVAPITETTFFKPDDIITFQAIATQANGQPVSENLIVWRDDLDGFLGTGSTINHKLSGGPGGPIIHHVTVSILLKNGKPTPKDTIVVKKGAVL